MPREPSWWYRPAGALSAGLAPVAAIWAKVAGERMARGGGYRSRLPVICVGNLTAGGSGKTPFTILLAQMLLERGEYPAVLTRGYGGRLRGPHRVDPARDRAADTGDEPLLLAREVPTFVSRDRRAGAAAIEAAGEATVILMDDGLQNPSLVKDLSFAVVDGRRGIGNGLVMPAGPLRAPLGLQAGFVDAVVFNGEPAEELVRTLALSCRVPQFVSRLVPDPVVARAIAGRRVVGFAGIGHPERFFETLRAAGADLVAEVPFADHARFGRADARRLIDLARRNNALLLTTEKDGVRMALVPALDALFSATAVLPVRMRLDDRAVRPLGHMLDDALNRAGPRG